MKRGGGAMLKSYEPDTTKSVRISVRAGKPPKACYRQFLDRLLRLVQTIGFGPWCNA
jgi:hypothetical protein